MSEQNLKLVQEAYAAFGRGDVDGILARAAQDIDWQMYGPAELPMGGQRKGHADVRRFFGEVAQAWNFTRFEPRDFVASGEQVIVFGHYTGTAKETSRPFDAEFCHVFTVQSGKVTKFREYTDTANLLGALNLTAARV